MSVTAPRHRFSCPKLSAAATQRIGMPDNAANYASRKRMPSFPERRRRDRAGLAPWLVPAVLLLAVVAATRPAGAQGSRIGAPPVGPAPQGAMPPPMAQVLPDEVEEAAIALRAGSLKGTKAYSIVAALATEVGPRPAGSPQDRLAVAWALRTLQGFGFSNVHTEKVTVPHWQRGAESGEITAPFHQRVVLTALGGSVATPAAGIEAPVVEVPSLEALDKLDAGQVKGKIVFYNVATDRTRDASGYGRAVVVRGRGAAHAAARGAVAVLIRSIGTDSNRLPHTGGMRPDNAAPPIPAAALSGPDADLLAAELASGQPVRLRLKLETRSLPAAESANVIGEIRGREKPDEIVLLACHLDSWDLGTGALDDGAGCAIVIEAARRIGELKVHPRRTLRVVLFANEEFGLSGAEAYAKAHAAELSRHVVAAESDLGTGRVWRLESRVALESMGWVHDLNRLVFSLGVSSGSNQGEGGADLRPLQRVGVPILSLMQDATIYFDYHHTANDTLDKVNAKDLDYNVAAWTAVAYTAAEIPGDFGRVVYEEKEQ